MPLDVLEGQQLQLEGQPETTTQLLSRQQEAGVGDVAVRRGARDQDVESSPLVSKRVPAAAGEQEVMRGEGHETGVRRGAEALAH